jgi:hypothetical protein
MQKLEVQTPKISEFLKSLDWEIRIDLDSGERTVYFVHELTDSSVGMEGIQISPTFYRLPLLANWIKNVMDSYKIERC